ncbi:MAG TPA: ABC transporter permease, partial [Pseudorhodoferax sp.]|nr:ABC transporter permease [Pseudorhodoferax sp.]
VGTLVRDIQQLTGVLGLALLFLSPVFYNLQTAPAAVRKVLQWNPVTLIVEQLRAVLFQGQLPAMGALAAYVAVTSVFAWLALKLFKRMQPMFADLV